VEICFFRVACSIPAAASRLVELRCWISAIGAFFIYRVAATPLTRDNLSSSHYILVKLEVAEVAGGQTVTWLSLVSKKKTDAWVHTVASA
jgi:hypothetical protein